MKTRLSFLTIAISLFFSINLLGQSGTLTINPIGTMSARQLVEEYFLGRGVVLDTTHPIIISGQVNTNTNQIGTFTNSDTSYGGSNIPIKEGIILATTNVTAIATNALSNSSTASPNHSSTSEISTICPMMYYDYMDYCANNPNIQPTSLNNMVSIDFWIIPSSTEMSFKYSFGSREYPNYVCSSYNDIFGLYIDGPFDSDGELSNSGVRYNQVNIATVPNTSTPGEPGTGDKVMINTINAGTTNNNCAQYNGNSVYFIANDPQTCTTNGLGGYTRKLTTEVVTSEPCKSYHIQISICNIGDNGYQSAVFLEKGSFNSEMINIDHNTTATNDKIDSIYLKGCSSDTMLFVANYIARADENPYAFTVKGSDGSNITRGIDYEYIDLTTNTPINNQITIPAGQDTAKVLLTFLHNTDKEPGTIDTLWFISDDKSMYECLGTDTIVYIMQEPLALTCQATGGKTLCADILPAKDTIQLNIQNATNCATISIFKGVDSQEPLRTNHYSYEYGTQERVFLDTFLVSIMNVEDTQSYIIRIEDSCGRVWDTIISYPILGTQTQASSDKDVICIGDTVTLSCPENDHYIWTCSPTDTTLAVNGQDTTRNPQVAPKRNTKYYIEVISNQGCKAYDTISVNIEPIVQATMSLKPKTVKFSDPTIEYTDLARQNNHTCLWDFGDQEQSTQLSGQHTYMVDNAEQMYKFPVTLITYNSINCPDTAIDTITIMPDFTIWLPNAFVGGSTRGEDIATFGPKGTLLEDWELFIFNRWGGQVFYGHNIPWDGKTESGDWAKQGTYAYLLKYKDQYGREQRTSGKLTLLLNAGD